MDRSDPFMSNLDQHLHTIDSNTSTALPPGDFKIASGNLQFDAPMQHAHSDLFSTNGPDLMSPFSPDFNLANFDTAVDSKLSGAQSSSVAGITSAPNTMMTTHRQSVGSMGSGLHHRRDSFGATDQWSPTSPREQQQNSDENLANATGDAKKNSLNEEKPPAWSELKTKAGKERKRLPLACIACRRKKIRCSGEKPACQHCLRSRIPCVYKVTTRKAAPRTDYMAMLDKRLKRMEERVIKFIPKDELPDMSVVGRAVVRPAIPTHAPKSHRPSISKKRSAGEAFVSELEEWTKSKGQPDIPESILRRQQIKPGEENTFLTEGADFLPSPELQEHLAEIFFDCIYGQSYLLLHKPSFMRKLKAGNVPPVLTLAVCAISARFSTHPEVATEPAFLRGDAWASPARAIIEQRHYEPNITILTVMLILGLHYFGTCEGGLSWSFGGQAMRMAYALQLHRELDHDPLGRKTGKSAELSFTDREIRRRTFWACFLMDRFNASGTERPPFGSEDFIHIQLPIKESYFQMEIPGPTEDLDGGVPNPVTPGNGQISDPKANMGVAAYIIRAVVLWGRIVKYLNLGGKEKDTHSCWTPESGFMILRHQVREFNESLPPLLQYSQENLQIHAAERLANQFLYLHIICQQNVLFLNRFAIPLSPGARPPRDIPKDFLNECGRMVIQAADQISKLIEAAAGHLLTAPFAGYSAYASSTVHVWGIFSKQPQLEAASKENLRYNYKYLNKMKKYWGMFHYMAESIKDVYRSFADAALRGPSTPGSGQQQLMFQYGDWFDKYPHGVAHTDWADTGNELKKEPGTEAVMSHQSELQSVEEFFASLSPPSKVDNPRKAARRSTKSAGESGRGKKQTNKMDTMASQNATAQKAPEGPAPFSNHDVTSNALPVPENHFHDPNTPFPSQNQPVTDFNMLGNPNHPSNFPYHSLLGELDRQLVFDAYAGLDTSGANLGNVSSSSGFNHSHWEGIDLNGMDTNNTSGFFGGNNDPTSAWFMPFNMDPPEIGKDNAAGMFGDLSMGMGFGGGSSFATQGGQGPPSGGSAQGGMSGLDDIDLDLAMGGNVVTEERGNG